MRRGIVVTVALAGCLAALPARADFDATSDHWTGLTKLVATLQSVHVKVDVATELDWSQIDEARILWLVAPDQPPTYEALDNVRRFVDAGGRLLVADDYAAGRAWVMPFGLLLRPEPGTRKRHYERHVAFPEAAVDPESQSAERVRGWLGPHSKLTPQAFLAHNLNGPVVLNHPAQVRLDRDALGNRRGVIWGRYDDAGAGWLAEVEYGRGRVLALADSSVFINAMLDAFYDNQQLAANLALYGCVRDRPCRLLLVPALSLTKGTFVPREPQQSGQFRSGLEQLAEWLQRVADALHSDLMAPLLLLCTLVGLGAPIALLARTPEPVTPPELQTARRHSVVWDTVGQWLANDLADYRRPARLLAAQLASLVQTLDATARGEDGPAHQPTDATPRTGTRSSGSSVQRAGTGFGVHLPAHTVDALVRSGRCSPQAAERLRTVVAALQEVVPEDAEPVTRAHFGQLAIEVEWAESLIRHTQRGGGIVGDSVRAADLAPHERESA
jgi:hypothetical protein